jgi:hypothetical protein
MGILSVFASGKAKRKELERRARQEASFRSRTSPNLKPQTLIRWFHHQDPFVKTTDIAAETVADLLVDLCAAICAEGGE